MAQHHAAGIPVYSPAARRFHWWVVLLLAIQLPLGYYMMYRAEDMPGVNDKGEPVKGVWNGIADGGLTDTLFSGHKVIGILILLTVLARLLYRLFNGAPKSDPSVPAALTGLSHAMHWGLYLLLIAVPVAGYVAISFGRFLDVFGVRLPAVTPEDQEAAKTVFHNHELGAFILVVLAGLHIAAAVYHKAVRKDRVVERMLPKKMA